MKSKHLQHEAAARSIRDDAEAQIGAQSALTKPYYVEAVILLGKVALCFETAERLRVMESEKNGGDQ